MLASLFQKSTPFNSTVLAVIVTLLYLIAQLVLRDSPWDLVQTLAALVGWILVLGGCFLLSFIVQKNQLTRDNDYALLYLIVFICLFPRVLIDFNILASSFLILLALRRLISMHSPKMPKEKIFDASLYIFVASLFSFWSILFIILVFASIFFHVSRDYRNWMLPFLAFLAILIMSSMANALFFDGMYPTLGTATASSFDFDYFQYSYQNLTFTFFAVLFSMAFFGVILTMNQRPLLVHSSFYKVIWAVVLAVGVWVVAPDKSNEVLAFTFAPLAILAASFTENIRVDWQRELVLGISFLLGIVGLVMTL